MRQRFLSLIGVSASAIAVVMWLPQVPLAGQTRTPSTNAATASAPNTADNWTAPRTPWGDPDLQGVYNTATATPLQRPREVGEKDVYSDNEAEELEAEREREIDAPPRPEYTTGNYNDHWFDPQRRKLTYDKRTSLIIISAGRKDSVARAHVAGARKSEGSSRRGEHALHRRLPL